MDALLQLPFSASEEEALVQFLFNSRESFHKDLLITYFLQRSQPLEAAHVNERIKPPLMVIYKFPFILLLFAYIYLFRTQTA